MNVQHESRTDKWYTTMSIIERVHLVLGRVDLDPASDVFGNSRVAARRFIDESADALSARWTNKPVSVFCNPPGGKQGNKSKAALFWGRLMELRASELLKEAIYMGFSLEQLQTTQNKGFPSIGQFTMCIPAKRICFDTANGEPGEAPSHSNVIVYVPGLVDSRTKFREVFADLGVVIN